MSIEKKSLISNRSAAKKANVAKPQVNKVSSTKVSKLMSSPTRAYPARIARVNPAHLSTLSRVKF